MTPETERLEKRKFKHVATMATTVGAVVQARPTLGLKAPSPGCKV